MSLYSNLYTVLLMVMMLFYYIKTMKLLMYSVLLAKTALVNFGITHWDGHTRKMEEFTHQTSMSMIGLPVEDVL